MVKQSRGFFRSFWKFIVGGLASLGLMMVLSMVFVAGNLRSFTEQPTTVLEEDEQVVVHLKLSGSILEKQASSRDWRKMVAQYLDKSSAIYLPSTRRVLEEAAKDDRVKGLFLEYKGVKGSLAQVSELRLLLDEFQKSGKPIYAYADSLDNLGVYLTSVATELSMPEVGSLFSPGPNFQLTYFSEALENLGVEVQVVRTGKYKSAAEPFIAKEPSEATYTMYQALEKSLRQHMVQMGGESKNLAAIFKTGVMTAKAVVGQGLVAKVAYRDQAIDSVEKGFGKLFKFEDYEAIAFEKTAELAKTLAQESSIALFELVGPIQMSADKMDDAVITPDRVRKDVEWALEDDEVKGVVLRISSPGGSAVASDLIWRDIKRLAEKKPVVVSMGSYCASGGYYIASAAKKLLAIPTTITGSIGVFMMVPNFKNIQEKIGVKFYGLNLSDRNKMLDPGQRLGDSDKRVLKQMADEVYETFLNRVSTGRSMTREQVHGIAQGRVWTGLQALENGLVDKLGGLSDAFRETKILAGLNPDQLYPVKRRQPKLSLPACILSGRPMEECASMGSSTKTDALEAVVGEKASQLLKFLQQTSADPAQAVWTGYFGS